MARAIGSYCGALLPLAIVSSTLIGSGTPSALEAPATVTPAAVAPAAVAEPDQLSEVLIQAREPRYVASTRRDRIGRIWAPVLINGKGPFRLVLDTGASHSGVTSAVATALGIPLNASRPVILRGVTGSATVPTIRVDTLIVGDLVLNPAVLPIVVDALGGAEGVLGTEGLADMRIFIDFRHDIINIARSRGERAGVGFVAIPVTFSRGRLLVADAEMGGVRTKAIIDTGGQATIANLALRKALARGWSKAMATPDEITGATDDIQKGDSIPTPPIVFGPMQIRGAHITFGDMYIFEHWRMTQEPVVLIGMDALGLLDTLIIDYKRRELQLRMRN
jgi:Aspartyl protease